MRKEKAEAEKVIAYDQLYSQATYRVKILMANQPTPFIGVIKNSVLGAVEIIRNDSKTETWTAVPIKFQFEIMDVTNPINGEVIDLDTFSIIEIDFFPTHEAVQR